MTEEKTPKGLMQLCLTEFWERFGFYVVQAVLILYLTKGLHFSDIQGDALLGSFITLCYITPVIGGYLADNWLGYGASIFVGAALMAFGYISLALPSQHLLYLSLSIIITGNGFFKPNVTSLLGKLYGAENSANRDIGFIYFFVGINFGGLLSFLSSGYLINTFGWKANFGAAGLGLFISMLIFKYGLRYYQQHLGRKTELDLRFWLVFSLGLVATVSFLTYALMYTKLSTLFFLATAILIFLFILKRASDFDKLQRRKIFICYLLIFFSISYSVFDFQAFFSVTLFVSRVSHRELGGFTIPTPTLIGAYPLSIALFGLLQNKLWKKLESKGKNPSAAQKLMLGLFFASLGFVFLILGLILSKGEKVDLIWPIAFLASISCGELLIAPIGYSLITRLMPKELIAMTIGAWFVYCGGFGGKVAGWLANFAAVPQEVHSLPEIKAIYLHAFSYYFAASFIIAIISCLCISKLHGFLNLKGEDADFNAE